MVETIKNEGFEGPNLRAFLSAFLIHSKAPARTPQPEQRENGKQKLFVYEILLLAVAARSLSPSLSTTSYY